MIFNSPCSAQIGSPTFRLDKCPARGKREREVAAVQERREYLDTRGKKSGSESGPKTRTQTHLTSAPTPLHPSLPLVHPTRSFGFKFALDHVPPISVPFAPSPSPVTAPVVTVDVDVVDDASSSHPSSSPSRANVTTDLRRFPSPASWIHRSFSHSSTWVSGARQTVSSSLSLSVSWRKKR